jgi:hypothetical protein
MPHAAVGRALILLAGLAFAASAPAQKMYKWVDEKGVTHFSEHPPEDGRKAATIEPKVIPPSGPVAPPSKGAAETWKEKEADFRKRQIERGQRESADAREKAQREAKCDDARSKLAFYTTGRIFRDNPDGTRTWMTEDNRAAMLDRQRALIKEYCG